MLGQYLGNFYTIDGMVLKTTKRTEHLKENPLEEEHNRGKKNLLIQPFVFHPGIVSVFFNITPLFAVGYIF